MTMQKIIRRGKHCSLFVRPPLERCMQGGIREAVSKGEGKEGCEAGREEKWMEKKRSKRR